MSAIQRIEVLRDGAAAQYGSDAIAGRDQHRAEEPDERDATVGHRRRHDRRRRRTAPGQRQQGLVHRGRRLRQPDGRSPLPRRNEPRGRGHPARESAARHAAHRRQPRERPVLLVELGRARVERRRVLHVRRRVAPHGRFGRLLPLRRRWPQRAGRVPERLPAEHPHHRQGCVAGRRLPPRPGQRVEDGRLAQPRPQRTGFPRKEHHQRQLLVRAETGRRHLRRVAAGSGYRQAEIQADDVQRRPARPAGCPGQQDQLRHRLRMAPRRLCNRRGRSGLVPVRPHEQSGHRHQGPDGRRGRIGHAGLPRLHARHRRRRRAPQHRAVRRHRTQHHAATADRRRRALGKILGLRQHDDRQAVAALRPEPPGGLPRH
ncbi:conserved hypothetical protein, partial [Ricinus communis]